MEQQTAKERQTRRFITANPTGIVFTRHTRNPDGAGGYLTTPTDLPEQVVRIVQQRRAVAVERRNSAGEAVSPSITLVCEHDADVQRSDTFTWQGLPAEVVWVTDLGYVKHAEVAI